MSTMINWPARFAEMVDFVGLSEEDRQLIKASAPIILARAGHLNDSVYDQLLQYPQARQFFVTDKSTNGTWVEGKRLKKGVEEPLPERADIGVAEVLTLAFEVRR